MLFITESINILNIKGSAVLDIERILNGSECENVSERLPLTRFWFLGALDKTPAQHLFVHCFRPNSSKKALNIQIFAVFLKNLDKKMNQKYMYRSSVQGS